MKLIYKISLLVLVMDFTACKRDFLEIEPHGSKLPFDEYLKTDEEVFSALIGVYDVMQFNYSHGDDESAGTTWANVFFIKNLPADDVLCAGSSPSGQIEYQNMDDFEISSNNAKIESIWTNFYKTINASNNIINGVANIENATETMKEIAAEAKALRAFTYFDLVVLFGGVPLYSENPNKTEDFHKPRATVSAVYAQIEKDLNEAVAILPLKSELSESHKFRFSKGAAQALLGKVYLYQGKAPEAASILAQVIASGEYDLEPNVADVWSIDKEFGTESLFEISYVSTEAYEYSNFPWSGSESNIEIQLQGPNAYVFDFSNSSLDAVGGWGYNLPSAEIGDLFTSENETSRYNASLISQSDFEATGGSVSPGEHHDYEAYLRLKYVTKPSATNTNAESALNYGTNWKLIRYADILLLSAEAYHLSGNDTKALIELNKVRIRANMPNITATGAALFAAIKKERQLELAFEASRYWDLIRWGDANAELSDIGFVSGKHELFPIPLNEIIANNAMDMNEQNTGY